MRAIVYLCLLMSTPCLALDKLQLAIKRLQPNIAADKLESIANAVKVNSEHYGLDWRLMVSIIAQESSFKQDPQQCLNKSLACKDFGLSQVNFKTWANTLKLDKKKLLVDVNYNIETMAKILFMLKSKYGHEFTWHGRYHSNNPKRRSQYEKLIFCKYKMVLQVQ